MLSTSKRLELYATFFVIFLECSFFSNHLQFILTSELSSDILGVQFVIFHMKGEAYAQSGELGKALKYFTKSYQIACEEETEWSFKAVYESVTCCFIRYEIDSTADVAPELRRAL